MKIITIKFDDNGFRNLKNLDIEISPRITIIAGHNGIGKSTILGLIANGSELKSHKTLLDKPFRAEFSEIFFLDYYGDFLYRTKPSCATLIYHTENSEPIYKNCSVTGNQKTIINKKQYKNFMGEVDETKLTESQKQDLVKRKEKYPSENFIYIPRMRVIPRTDKESSSQIDNFLEDNNIGDSAKLTIPTIYLGMSRVSPIGEFDQHEITRKKRDINNSTVNYIYNFFNDVIPNGVRKSEQNITSHTFGKSKKASLVPEFQYSSLSISLGQDSLSAITSAFASFFQLKEELGDKYHGGILIIDEIEAGLHPKAQLRLIQKIQKQARDLKLQVIATTHSLTVIKEILESNENQSKSGNILDSVVYLMDTRLPKIMTDPNYTKIKSDMLLLDMQVKDEPITVYFEDDEAKYFFEKIMEYRRIKPNHEFGKELDLIPLKIGCNILISLSKAVKYFKSTVIVLDNDVATRETNREIVNQNDNICILPQSVNITENSDGAKRTPEGLIYDFLLEKLNDCQDCRDFWQDMGRYTTDYVEENIINLSDNQRKNRDYMKKWFEKSKIFFEEVNIFHRWCELNDDYIVNFIKDFEKAVDSAYKNLEMAKLEN